MKAALLRVLWLTLFAFSQQSSATGLLSRAQADLLSRLIPRRLAPRVQASKPRGLAAKQCNSALTHNGTHMERVVDVRWECTYPKGECFARHAPLEGMPEKYEACSTSENLTALSIRMVIDLQCANVPGAACNTIELDRPFDPFIMCNNDPDILKATCHFECREAKPFEVCILDFDLGGKCKLDDESVELCKLEATCMSPYIERNQMVCSSHHTASNSKPHWVTEDLPWHWRANHSMEAPKAALKALPPLVPATKSHISEVLWGIAEVMLAIAVPLWLWRRCGSSPSRDLGYHAPRVEEDAIETQDFGSAHYVAPAYPPVLGPRPVRSEAWESGSNPSHEGSVH